MSSQAISHRFIGGMRTRWFNASWPLAELLLQEKGVTIRVRWKLLRALFLGMSSKTILWDQLSSVRDVTSSFSFLGQVRLEEKNGKWTKFYTGKQARENILQLFAQRLS